MRKKDYSELTFTDDFMFCKVLENNLDLCKGLLELTLGFRIKDLKVSQTQTQIEEKYDARGIRLDVYAVAEDNTIYDIEMQTTLTKDLPKRTRYYQGMIDLNLIGRGARFGELKRTYIIFICTEDPFEKNLPIYTFENTCRENTNVLLGDEAVKVIVNAQGDRENLSNEMKAFLDFLQSGKSESTFTSKLKEAVERAKHHKEWEVEFMTMYMKIQEERDDAQIEQMIETGRRYGASTSQIIGDLMSKFNLSKDEAEDRIKEFDLQLA